MYSKKVRFFGFLTSKINVFEIKQAGRNLSEVLQALSYRWAIFSGIRWHSGEKLDISVTFVKYRYTKGTVLVYITLKKDSNIIHI